ncbi:uncharacterized protein EAF01_005624 [Botrytis porri]|uniref:uncharacterized protein n=1 Tax=Botrytis porri TaxID=87229 RepID=UPI0019004C1A|nr:uncharacterized protein EAF01_005624 [Botrytis porri]KAF7905103.1 hypothetical protein EAF01_005624 [Botrytis porri]
MSGVLGPVIGGIVTRYTSWRWIFWMKCTNRHRAFDIVLSVHQKWEENLATTFPWRLIKNRVYMFGLATTLLMGFPYFVVIYSLPLRFQVVNGKSPLTAGLRLLPMLGSTAVASFLGGMLNGKKSTVSPSTLSNTEYVEAKTYGFLVFVGLGFGLTVSTVSMLFNYESSIRDHAVAQGITSQARILGGSIGIAASTTILSRSQQTQLTDIVTREQLASLESSANSMTFTQLHAVRQAYADSFSEDMKVCAIVAGLCVLVVVGTWKRNLVTVEQRFREQIEKEVRRLKGGVTQVRGLEEGKS